MGACGVHALLITSMHTRFGAVYRGFVKIVGLAGFSTDSSERWRGLKRAVIFGAVTSVLAIGDMMCVNLRPSKAGAGRPPLRGGRFKAVREVSSCADSGICQVGLRSEDWKRRC